MARRQRDVVNYFPHDANASSGDTLTVLQSRFGNDGYAFWFKLLEKLSSTEGHYLDCRSPIKWRLLLAKMGVNEITGVEIMNLLVEMQAIDKELWDSKIIWCQKLVDNVSDVYKNRRRKIPQMPIPTNTNPISTPDNSISLSNHPVVIPQSKLNKSKLYTTTSNGNLDENLAKISQLYEDNIGRLTSVIADRLKDAVEQYPVEWLEESIKEAVKLEHRNLKYIESILERWQKEGFKSPKPSRRQGESKLPTTQELEEGWK